MSNPTVLDIARDYVSRGWKVVPVPERGKNPNRQGWQTLALALDELPAVFKQNGTRPNIGVLQGKPSGNLADVDLDTAAACILGALLLPKTGAVFGRVGKPRSHYLYYAANGIDPETAEYRRPGTKKTDGEKAMLVELRGTGAQTIFPGSIHESGESIEWASDGAPAVVDMKDLAQTVRRIAAGAALVPFWVEGARHGLALALAGALLRAGWEAEQAGDFIEGVAQAADDPEAPKRRTDVESTAERLAAGENVVGLPTLAEQVDDKAVVKALVSWLGLAPAPDPVAAAGDGTPAGNALTYNLTDVGNAERLIAQHGADLRYMPARSAWYVYTGQRWMFDEDGEVMRRAKAVLRGMYAEAATIKDDSARQAQARHALRCEATSRVESLVRWAQKEPGVSISIDAIDRDIWLLNCANSTLNLKTGQLQAHRRTDYLTRIVPVAYRPDATCPRWIAFLDTIMGHNEGLRRFLQRAVGYSLTGDTSEDKLFILHGTGRNGKTTFLETIARLLGPYGMRTPTETLMARRSGGIPNDVARLKGARFVHASETNEGQRLDEAFIKDITGGDTQSARFLHGEFFDFKPELKLWLRTNHRPDIKDTSDGMWARVSLIPFETRIPDSAMVARWRLEEMFNAEMEGIFAWAVQGCREWLQAGLQEPSEVRTATKAYRSDMDDVQRFIAEQCVVGPTYRVASSALYNAFKTWSEEQGERRIITQTRLAGRLKDRGYQSERANSGMRWIGIDLRPNDFTGSPTDDSPTPTPQDTDNSVGCVGCVGNSEVSREDKNIGGKGENCLHTLHTLHAEPDDNSMFVGPDTPAPAPILTCLYCGTVTPGGIACEEHRGGMTPSVAPVSTPSVAPTTITVGASYPDLPVRTLATVDDVQRALPALLAAPVVGVDTETTRQDNEGSGLDPKTAGLDPLRGRIRLVQLATAAEVYLLDTNVIDPRVLAPLFDASAGAGPLLVAQNAAFDLRFLHQAGLATPAAGSRLFDTELADRLLTASAFKKGVAPVRHGLGAIARRVLGLPLDKSEQKSDWSGVLTEEQLRYAALDAAILPRLAERLQADLARAGLERVAALEMRALPAVAWLMESGVPFDGEAWRRLALQAEADTARIEQEMTAFAGTGGLFAGAHTSVKWSSTQQVAAFLRERGHSDITSTDEAALHQLADAGEPLAPLLLQHREASKRASTYGLDYLKHVHSLTGCIHASFRQLGSEAGRMSATDPNVQQVPRGKAYRACVRPGPGRVLVKCDYAQIELRLAAQIAPDERLVEAFQRGDDLHTVTARTVLGKTDVTKADRQAAKAVNFGLLYGMGAKGLRQYAADEYGVQWTEEEAQTVRGRFFAQYRGLQAWHRSQPDGEMETRTVAGRRRLGVERFTEKLNTPVQGSGADGLKAALGILWETRDRASGAAPILVVHDEIVVECDRGQADEARAWVVDAMRSGMETVLHRVPAEVEATICADWSGAALHISNVTAPREGV